MKPAASPAGLAGGLQSLREEGILCDAVLVVEGPQGEERIPAHQAVLAAASQPLAALIQAIPSNKGAAPERGSVPQPLELRMAGVTDPTVMKAALDHAYGQGSPATKSAKGTPLLELGRALQLAGLGGPAVEQPEGHSGCLAQGLQRLRAKSFLCDMQFVVAGGTKVAAHQAVLAAVSPSFRAGVMGGVEAFVSMSNCPEADRDAQANGLEAEGMVSQSIELELEGVENASALRGVLNHIYDGAQCLRDYKPASFEINRDVLRLALALELPLLRKAAEGWLVDTVTETNAEDCLVLCDNLPVAGDLRERLRGRLPAALPPPVPKAGPPADAEKEAHARASKPAAGGPAAAAAQAPAPKPNMATPSALNPPSKRRGKQAKNAKEGADEQAAAPAEGEGEAPRPDDAAGEGPDAEQPQDGESQDNSHLYQTVKSVRYASAQVPEPHDLETVRLSAKDAKVVATLQRIFMERPVWLEQPLLKALPPNLEYDTLLRLLPHVAYQWSDGPWQTAYAALGWDPRAAFLSDDAKYLQVIQFRDPFFKKNSAAADNDEVPDFTFRRPPTMRVQPYQLLDIKDEFISEMIDSAETETECNRRTGWLTDLVLGVVKERMTVKSQQQREARAKRELFKGGSARSSSLPAAKRARAGGGA